MVKRIDATEKAVELINILKRKHGDLMFYQAGGCCEGLSRNVLKKAVITKEWAMSASGQLKIRNFGSIKIYSNIGNTRILP